MRASHLFSLILILTITFPTVLGHDEPKGASKCCMAAAGLLGIATASTTVVAAPAVLTLAGFTGTGVASSSLAAAWQSSLGAVVNSGGLFASLQSIAAAGFSASTFSGVGITVSAASLTTSSFCTTLEACNICSPLSP